MQAKFLKLNGNFREIKPLSKVFNSGLSSWRPLKSEKVSTLSETPHLPGWVSAYSVSASRTPSEEGTASSGSALPNYQPLPHCEKSVCKFIDSLTLIDKIQFYQGYSLPEHFCSKQKSMAIVTTAYLGWNPTLLEKIEFYSKLQVKPRKNMLNLKLYWCIFFYLFIHKLLGLWFCCNLSEDKYTAQSKVDTSFVAFFKPLLLHQCTEITIQPLLFYWS